MGEHDRETFTPIPDHISANVEDLNSLMNGLLNTNNLLQDSKYDPVLTAATIAFGFVFIHPLSDGNGRIHRYLIHHILTWMEYTKRDMISFLEADHYLTHIQLDCILLIPTTSINAG